MEDVFMNCRPLIVGALLFPIASQAGEPAAPESAQPTELPAVTVTASPLLGEEGHIAQPVTVLRGEELRAKENRSIGETLTRELGVSSTSFGLGASRPIIRGLGGSRVRILEGGIGSMDVSNLSDDHGVSVDPAQANQIEILKGPSTLLYGSGAVGGVVNVVTNRIPTELYDTPTGRLSFRHDTATNERAGHGSVDASLGSFGFHLDGVKRRTSDYDIPAFGSLNPQPGERRGRLAFSDVDTENIAGGASYIGERGYLGFSLAQFDSHYGIPGEGARIVLEQLRYDIAGELKTPFAGFSLAKFKLGHNDYQHQELEPSGEPGTTFLNDEYEGRIEWLHNPVWDFEGVVGVQIQHRDFDARGEEALTPPVQGRSVGIFVVEERDWDRWHLELGARHESTEYDAEEGAPDVSHNVYSLSGGTVWQFVDGYSIGMSLTRAQRAPSIEEIYNNGPHLATLSFERGDIGLTPETANNFDLTLRKLDGRWTWRANAFVNYIEEFIFADSVDDNGDGLADFVDEEGEPIVGSDGLQVIQFSQHDAVFYGFEFETGLKLFSDTTYGELNARVFTDYVRGKLTNGDNLPRITPLRVGGGLDYNRGPWHGDIEVRRVQRQEDAALLETETAGYTLLNASISYTLKTAPTDLTLSLQGTNLLDEDIRYHTSFLKAVSPQPGQSVMVTLRAEF
jgi:iron complex outermembrane receptor protein